MRTDSYSLVGTKRCCACKHWTGLHIPGLYEGDTEAECRKNQAWFGFAHEENGIRTTRDRNVMKYGRYCTCDDWESKFDED